MVEKGGYYLGGGWTPSVSDINKGVDRELHA